MQISEKIRQARLSANLTEEELAEKIGVKRSTYQYWEKKTPSLDKIGRIAQALELPNDYFFGNEAVVVDNADELNTRTAIQNQAYIRVILRAIGELLANQRSESATKTLSDLEVAAAQEERLLLERLKQSSHG